MANNSALYKYLYVFLYINRHMQRFMMSVSEEMYAELEKERKLRRLETVQEVARQMISDYLKNRNGKERTCKLLERDDAKTRDRISP